jgi:hypothetical protein
MLSENRFCSSPEAACPLNAIGTGCSTRSAQCVHFEIVGARVFQSAVGTSQGHASMQ